jgi:hypothetical protein
MPVSQLKSWPLVDSTQEGVPSYAHLEGGAPFEESIAPGSEAFAICNPATQVDSKVCRLTPPSDVVCTINKNV